MDVDEGKHSADTPSEFSADLSAIFAGKGQMPHLTELNPDPRFSQWEWSDGVFLTQQGFWEFSIDASKSNTRTVFVTGKPSIAARGCFIRDTKELIPWPYVDERRELLKGGGTVTLRGQPHISLVVTDPCELNTAALIISGRCVLTLDGFISTLDVAVPDIVITNGMQNVTDIAITSSHIFYLMSEGALLAQNRTSGDFSLVEVPQSVVLRQIQGREWCQHSEIHMFENAMFIGWNEEQVYIWEGPEMKWKIPLHQQPWPIPLWLDLDHLQAGVIGHSRISVENAAFTTDPQEVAILLRLSDGDHVVFTVIKFDMVSVGWKDHVPLFYNQTRPGNDSGSDLGKMAILNDPANDSLVESSIQQVIVTESGPVALLSTTNILYTSMKYQQNLIKHSSLASPDSDLALYIDQLDRVYLLSFNESDLERVGYALRPDIKTTVDLIDPNLCAFIQFRHSPKYQVYYIDIRDSASFWAELIFTADRYNDIETVTVTSSFQYVQPAVYQEALAQSTGFVTMEMRPRRLGTGCNSPLHMIAHLEVGCPPRRHIKVQKPAECDDVGSFTISKDTFWLANGQAPTEDMEVTYNQAVHGCPVRLLAGETLFKPIIELYDGDTMVENMTANYVIWEDNRRHDFMYTLSMNTVGCLREAQTWEEMTNLAGRSGPMQDIWGPQNYESCFIYGVTDPPVLESPYQVLNHSSENRIQLRPRGGTSLFLFTAQVVDPNYSFCRLLAKFAIVVEDDVVEFSTATPVMKISIGTFAAVTCTVGILSYLYYRQKHIQDLDLDIQHNYADRTETRDTVATGLGEEPGDDSIPNTD
ncbi:cation channel sperm-associated auxiliary subunit epsilon-like [Diadema antillarum]|uniref:cation channel sperm-associated auxiliary subunit epsilon-like n=1 Tax=Diadema antillarum TaxID=105358 RepID=UPI003A89AED4